MIDTHQHAFWHGRDDHGLVADMDEHGIEYAWLLTWNSAPFEDSPSYHRFLNPLHIRGDGTHAGIPLSDLVKAKEHYPDRFILGYCPHPLMGDAPALLSAAHSMYGLKVCGEWKFRIPFDDPRCIEIFRVAGDLKLPVVLHLDVPWLTDGKGGMGYQPLWFGGTIDNLERALNACSKTIFIGHAPGFWREISADASEDPAIYPSGSVVREGRLYGLLDRNPNLYADLSAGSGRGALKRDPAHAAKFLERFHKRLLFARDEYGRQLHEFLEGLALSKEARENIYYRNAERLATHP